MGREVGTPALFARLDEDHQASVRPTGALCRFDRHQRGIGRIAVVRSAPSVQPVAVHDRGPRAEVVAPSFHLGLFVEVAVQHHRVVGAVSRSVAERRNLHDDEWCESRYALDVDS